MTKITRTISAVIAAGGIIGGAVYFGISGGMEDPLEVEIDTFIEVKVDAPRETWRTTFNDPEQTLACLGEKSWTVNDITSQIEIMKRRGNQACVDELSGKKDEFKAKVDAVDIEADPITVDPVKDELPVEDNLGL